MYLEELYSLGQAGSRSAEITALLPRSLRLNRFDIEAWQVNQLTAPREKKSGTSNPQPRTQNAERGTFKRGKRDLLHNIAARTGQKKAKPSLFGSVRSGDIADEEIQKAKTALFRDLEDL